jgi:hypothetical protein
METEQISQKYLALRYKAGLPRLTAFQTQHALSDAYTYAQDITAQTGVDIQDTMIVVLADFVNDEKVKAAQEMQKMAADIPLFNGALPLMLNPSVT